MPEWKERIKTITAIFRAKLGLTPEEDYFQGLIHTNDDRERTRLTTRNIYRQAYMILLSDCGGDEWSIVKNWAEQERHLFISEDGQRATDFIGALARKQEMIPVTNVTMQQAPEMQKQEKRGLFR